MKFLASLLLCVILAAVDCGCATTSGDSCAKFKASLAQGQAVVTAAQAAITADQQVIATLPPNDPIRRATEQHLPQVQSVLAEAQIALTLTQIAAQAACPEIAAPTSQPSK